MGTVTYEERTFKRKYSLTTIPDPRGGRQGVFVIPCNADTPHAKQYYDKDGNLVKDASGNIKYRLEFNRLDHWFVSDVEFEEREVNGKPKRFAVIKLVDGPDECYLELERGSRWWEDLAYRISHPKFDLAQPISLRPYALQETEGGKTSTDKYLVILQNGEKIGRRWNKENDYGANDPAGAPPAAVKDPDDGTWSFKERHKWIDAMIYQRLQKTLREAPPMPAAPAPADTAAPATADPEDDLPF